MNKFSAISLSRNEKTMTKNFNIIYLGLAPFLFGLSWFISHELFNHFMKNKGTIENPAKDNSFVFACGFSFLYLLVFFIIRDLYPKKNNKS